MFLGRQMVHQQVDLTLSRFLKGLAAELASDQTPPTRLAFADRINRAPRNGDRAKWGLTSIHSTAEEIVKFGAPRQIPAALADKSLSD
jgi:hypothetical protein